MTRNVFFCFIVLFLAGCTHEDRLFRELRRDRRDTDKAKSIASQLMDTDRGVALAFEDFDCFGGTTRGWSNWMLEHSTHSNINSRLLYVHADTNTPHSKRVASAWILWNRTHQPSYVIDLFRLVEAEGPKANHIGRRLLASLSTNQVLQAKLLVDSSRSLSVTTNEVLLLLEEK